MSRLGVALLIAGTVAIAVTAIALRARQTRRSPRYALQQLEDAFRKKDRAAVARYIDVRRVAESIVDEASVAAAEQSESRPTLVTVLEQSFWAAMDDSTRVVEGVTNVQQRDDVARAGVRVKLPQLDSVAVVHVVMERAHGSWRVIKIEDLAPALTAARGRRLERAYEAAMESDLRNLVTAEAMYFADHGAYTTSLRALTYSPTEGVRLEVVEANRDGWKAVARHELVAEQCRIGVGAALRAGEKAGMPTCSL